MNELIKEAEKLYEKIDKAQVHLINARLNNDEEDKKSAISEMETAMCNAMQLLKCFIDRKGNIVSLSEICHDATDEPMNDSLILYQSVYDDYLLMRYSGTRRKSLASIKKWIYIEDLLPKVGE